MPSKPAEPHQTQLTDEQLQSIVDAFEVLDNDRDGFLTRNQLTELMNRLQISAELQRKLDKHLQQLGLTAKDVLSRVEVLKLTKKLMLKGIQQEKSRYEQLKGWFDGEGEEAPQHTTGFFQRNIDRNQIAAAKPEDVESGNAAGRNEDDNSDFEYYSYDSDSGDELIVQSDVQIQRTSVIKRNNVVGGGEEGSGSPNSPFVPEKRTSISQSAPPAEVRVPVLAVNGYDPATTNIATTSRRKTPQEQRAALAHSRKREQKDVGGGKNGANGELDRKKKRMKILMDPRVRNQLVRKKMYDAFFLQLVTLVQILMLAYEIYVNGGLESFSLNPFGGPSSLTLVQLGAKYVPCMRPDSKIIGDPDVICNPKYPGIGAFPKRPNGNCSYYLNLRFVCGMNGFSQDKVPDQIWRFITPLFVHNGFIHLLLCLVLQIKIGFSMEYQLGFLRTGFVFFSSGISGYLFASLMGNSGVAAGGNAALYGFIALLYLDLLQNWPITLRPWLELFKVTLVVFFALGIGLLPLIDNYAHIGGFIGGLFSGMAVMPIISYTKTDRRWKMSMRILAIPILLGLLSGGFYLFFTQTEFNCPWCQYLDCLPPNASWCRTT